MIRQSLLELHSALLKLHKALIDSERVVYEKEVGPIKSPNHFFQLLTSEPWFAWLRPISQLIVAIDETLDDKEPLTNASLDALMTHSVFCWSRQKEAKNLLSVILPLCKEIPVWCLPTRRSPSASGQEAAGLANHPSACRTFPPISTGLASIRMKAITQGFGTAIDPIVDRAALHEHVAGFQMDDRVVELHIDLA